MKDNIYQEGNFKKENIPWNKGKRKKLNLDYIKEQHWNNGKSILDISKELNISDALIRLRMKENNIPRRSNTILTQNTLNKLKPTQFKKGNISYFKGKSLVPWNKNKKGLQVAWNKGIPHSQEWKDNHSKYMKLYLQDHPEAKQKIKEARAKQIFPLKDSKIEVKIQSYLKALGIEFFTHQHMNIEHSYQCDILIPSMNIVIECDGDYWHRYPIGRDIDRIRTSELIREGFKVLRLWEHDIKTIDINKFAGLVYGQD